MLSVVWIHAHIFEVVLLPSLTFLFEICDALHDGILRSNAVWRGAGKGAQGWTSVMSNRQGLFIEELARNMTHEFLRRNDSAICSAQDSRADTLDQAQAGEDWRWVGGGKTGVRVPHFCPKSLEVAKVVVTKKLNLVRPEHQYAPVETRTDRKKRT